MPEAPDVEGHRRLVADHAVGRTVTGISVSDAGVLRNTDEHELAETVCGLQITECGRQGKWLLIEMTAPVIVMHFGMTGTLRWSDDGSPAEPWERARLSFDDGALRYADRRRLGGIWLAEPHEVATITGPLGPDVDGIATGTLTTRLRTRRGTIKAALIDQSVIAGLGNTLSDEVLWRARIHPAARIADLDSADMRRLRTAICGTVRTSFAHGRIPRTRRWLAGARVIGAPCPRCRHPLATSTIAGRTSAWCPQCQPPT